MKHKTKERRWVIFNNGCIHGVQHSQLTIVRSVPHRTVMRDTVSVFTLSKPFAVIISLAAITVLVLLLSGCQMAPAQKGGLATALLRRPGHTNLVTLRQSENPKEPSRQTVESEQTIEYVLPAGTDGLDSLGVNGGSLGVNEFRGFGVGRPISATPARSQSALSHNSQPPKLSSPQRVQVKSVTRDRTETSIGGAQKDTVREWAGKAAAIRPVMWAGVAMMTLVAGVLGYFGWWTKAAVAIAVGAGMIVLAQTLPDHGSVILLGGIGLFALAALLVLYAYHKGQLDQNHNGIPDIFERTRDVPF